MNARRLLPLLCLALIFAAFPAQAHEFLVKPVKLTVQKGEVVPFSVISSHVMMVSEEVEPQEHVKLALVEGKSSTALSVTPNPMLFTLDGQLKAKREGTAILAGHREGVVWTQTTKGWKAASMKGLDGVIQSNKYEKFCKTLLTVEHGDDGWKQVLGQKLEIVPLSDPTMARPGDELGFKVLLDGKPVTTNGVLATYDGFSYETMAFAYSGEPRDDGSVWVKVTAPGVWMVRVEHKINQPTEDYNGHVIRSVLIFEVQ